MYTTEGVPVIRGQDIKDAPYISLDDPVFVSEEVASSLSSAIVRPDDLVFPHRGAIGAVGLMGGRECLLSSSMMKLSCDKAIADPKYVLYYFRGRGRQELLDRASTVGTPGIGQPLRSLRGIPITLPEIGEQRAIAEVLGALDDKIAANRKLAGVAEAVLAAEFQLLGFDRGVDGERASALTEYFDLNPVCPRVTESEPTYVDMQKLPTSSMMVEDWESRPAKGGARFMNGDTLLARITPCLQNRKTGYVDFLDEGEVAIGSTEYIVIRSKSGIPSELSYFLATSERFRTFAIRHMVGTSGRQRLSANDLTEYPLCSVEPTALNRWGAIAVPLVKRLGVARDESRTLAATRDALLPRLMAGELRVRDAEREVEAVL
ncbi:restriction endonuclease subunit S domain-containing protein [Rhodococcus spongiicola]|uniref:Restriction endonuclease subunit S n=1 Tax=Rhodococcus spongiicola TaxID=2487352 RepID=A0A3S3ABB8_9NOCA|nr:restriction endonuclease subunit S [Rhodococcus spongiicola]RVW06286.1 restriction endonuclease subunit S [Rhodococcus spongiicola]